MPTQDERQGLLGRFGDWMVGRTRREATGARNAVPGTRNFQLPQLLDAFLLPGNQYDSQRDSRQWTIPRVAGDMGRGVSNFLGSFRRTPEGEPLTPGQAPLRDVPGRADAPIGMGPLPNYQQPGVPGVYGEGIGMFPAPRPGETVLYGDGSGVRPIPNYGPNPNAAYGSGRGMFPIQGSPQPGRQGEAGRFGTSITPTREAAVNMARGFAGTGLGARGGGGASSYGRDQLNRRNRMG